MAISADTKLELAPLSELDTPPLTLVAAAGEAGFDALGLRLVPATPGGVAYPLASTAERHAVGQAAAAAGVRITHVELLVLTGHDDAEQHRPLFEAGAALGATRVVAAGDDPASPAMAAALARACDVAADHGLGIDLEFMPFRGVASLRDAVQLVQQAGRSNARVLIDALHWQRSGADADDLRAVAPALLAGVQLCDGPRRAPPDLAREARQQRQAPGEGEFPLLDLLRLLPAGLPCAVEVPLYVSQPQLSLHERLGRLAHATRQLLGGL